MQMLFVIVAVVVCSASALTNTTDDSKRAAVSKVTQMLEDLQQKVLSEGNKETLSYDKFACFCKDGIAAKTKAIDDGTTSKGSLEANIESLAAARDGLDSDIEDLNQKIADTEKEIADARKEAAADLALYTTNENDLSMALTSLKDAIAFMEASKTKAGGISLAQRQSFAETLRTSIAMADALGLKIAPALLQAREDPEETWEYDGFHGGDIIAMLKDLDGKFKAEKSALDQAESARVQAFNTFITTKTNFIEDPATGLKKQLADKTEERATKIVELETASKDLTVTAATLLDDQSYLLELTQICKDKGKTHEQRETVRTDELSALTAAIAILKGTVTEKTTKATVRLVERSARVHLGILNAHSPAAMAAIEADAEAAEGTPLAFLQQRLEARAARPKFLDTISKALDKDLAEPERQEETSMQSAVASESRQRSDGRKAAVALLRSKGVEMKSTLLTALADEVAKDPFAKVKSIIQALIEKLLKDASAENTQKGWCDQELSRSTMKRTNAAKAVATLNAGMAKLEVRRDVLLEEISTLSTAILKLDQDQEDADTLRASEAALANTTIEEAEAGLEAVSEAIKILEEFYKTAAKGRVNMSLVQGPTDDMPDAGFDNGEAYLGSQGDATGVIGMLEVIKGDFVRTVKETEKSEAEAKKDHYDFTVTTQSSLAEKNTAKTEKTKEKDEAVGDLDTSSSSLDEEMLSLTTAIKELLVHKETCIDTGMSYSERVANREEEIAALKKALCIFENFDGDFAGKC
mmetsp:Transcript_76575/g.135685  ORF Transcript_76575/g.135685 Transcript_76575/m.135685 type:complete len:757 (+) Transcript_76575:81-2351(+)